MGTTQKEFDEFYAAAEATGDEERMQALVSAKGIVDHLDFEHIQTRVAIKEAADYAAQQVYILTQLAQARSHRKTSRRLP